jgi:hypothetical protein
MVRLLAALSLLLLSCLLPARALAVPISMLTGSITLHTSLTLPLSAGLTVFPGGLFFPGFPNSEFLPGVLPGSEIIAFEARGFGDVRLVGRPPSAFVSVPATQLPEFPVPETFFFSGFSVANFWNTSDAPVFVDVTVRTITTLSLSAGGGGVGVLGAGAFLFGVGPPPFPGLGGGGAALVPCFSELSLCPAQTVTSDVTSTTSRISIPPGHTEIDATLGGEFRVFLPLEPVPEPTTLVLWGVTAAGFGFLARRRRNREATS